MKNKLVKRILSVGLMAAMAVTLVAGCGGKGNADGDDGGNAGNGDSEFAGKSTEFTWWIQQTDSNGEYYETYEESPVVQYVNQQYWDSASGGIGTEENGRQLNLSFIVPITGSESENFNTMIGTGEYPEIMDLSRSPESPQMLYESGILMDLTEYVEKYMPNYIAFLEKRPELKPFVQVPTRVRIRQRTTRTMSFSRAELPTRLRSAIGSGCSRRLTRRLRKEDGRMTVVRMDFPYHIMDLARWATLLLPLAAEPAAST